MANTARASEGSRVFQALRDINIHAPRGEYTVEVFPPPAVPDLEWLREQPSRLLDAHSQVVGFHGRERELADLAAWRDAPRTAPSFLLAYAPGGQGKSRLAARFAEFSQAERWTVVQARLDESDGPPVAVPGGASGVLMVVDYADRWTHTALLRLFTEPVLQTALPTRVLLLARVVRWWPELRDELGSLRAHTTQLALGALAPDPASRREVFDAARNRFAAADLYALSDPEDVRPPFDLAHDDFGLVLALHMAALVAVDAHGRGERVPAGPHAMSAYLLDREYANWRRLFLAGRDGSDYGTPPTVMSKTVFAAALIGAVTYAAGVDTVERLRLGEPGRLLDDHRLCYPTRRGQVLEPLYPDRLAEDFLGLLLPGHDVDAYESDPWAAHSVATLLTRDDGVAPAFTPRAVTFLASAAERWPHVGPDHLFPLLAEDPQMAVDAGSAALTAVSAIPDADPAVLAAIDVCFPWARDVDLDVGIAAVAERLTGFRLAATSDPAEQAQLHHDLARRLSNAGQRAEALTAAETAVRKYREAGGHDEALARALIMLSSCQADLGDRAAVAVSAEEAVALLSPLAQTDPERHGAQLARALHNLGQGLAESGRLEDALQATSASYLLGERLSVSERAATMANLAVQLSRANRLEDALGVSDNTVALYRGLADSAGQRHDLAIAQNYRALHLLDLHRHDDALAAVTEAIGLLRPLAERNAVAYGADLAAALTNLGKIHYASGRAPDGVETTGEAVSVYRQMAAVYRSAYEPTLAKALNNLGVLTDNGLDCHREAVEILRRLAADEPMAFTGDLACALISLCGELRDAGRHADALVVMEEAVARHREIPAEAAADPGLAMALTNLGVILGDLGRHDEALPVSVDAYERYRVLAAAQPEAFRYYEAVTGMNLALRLSAVGRHDEALARSAEAVELLRGLTETQPVRDDHAAALTTYAHVRLIGGREHAPAMSAAQEAIRFYESTGAHAELDEARGMLEALRSRASPFAAVTAPRPDLSRMWTIANHALRPEERGAVAAKLVGIVTTGHDPAKTWVDKLNSGARDVVYLLPDRLLVVVPRPATDRRARTAMLMPGDVGGAADVLSVDLADVIAVDCPVPSPPGIRVFNAGPFARLTVVHDRKQVVVDVWVDRSTTSPDDFGRVARVWSASPQPTPAGLARRIVAFLERYFDQELEPRAEQSAAAVLELLTLRFARLGRVDVLDRFDHEELVEWLSHDLADDEPFRTAMLRTVP